MKKLANKLANSVRAVELTMDERLLLESPANHLKGRKGSGESCQGEGKFERVVQVTSVNNEIERFVVESPFTMDANATTATKYDLNQLVSVL